MDKDRDVKIRFGRKKRSKQNMHERNIRNHLYIKLQKKLITRKKIEIEEKD